MPSAVVTGLTSCQKKALTVLEREGNVFLTGAAGTGKSYLLDRYLSGKPSDAFPVVASTGAAAVIVGGRTFHSFFGIGILEGGIDATIARATRNRKVIQRLQRACCVIIDEISMLPGITLEAAETVARRARGNGAPWGGLRIIAVGDFAQLPPVTANQQNKDWAFRHPLWEESDFQPALLSTVMRTQDIDFLHILNFIREGIVNDRVRAFLDERTDFSDDDAEGTRLYPRRMQADQYNHLRLEALPGTVRTFQTLYEGSPQYADSAKRAMPIPDRLHLKEGALIMMRKNEQGEAPRFVNGSLGIVRHIGEELLKIKLLSGETVEAGPEKFSYLDGDGNEVASAWNFPVTLAWATTIHKAQGVSLDRLIVDLHALWEPGQAYVALSRVRSGDGLRIERWSPGSIRAEPLVTAFYNALAETARKYVPRPLFVPPVPPPAKQGKPKRPPASKRLERTRALLAEGKDIDSIASACSLTPATVIKYVEKLIKSGQAPSIRHLADSIAHADHIRGLFSEEGLERLRPVYDALNGSVSFEDLSIMRLVMMAEAQQDEVLSF